jgi:glycosyltransferase involved in cell wall biosynthesis
MPTVSCIMPTFNRATFVPNAIEYFLRQDIQDAELIIIDDGSDPVQSLIPANPRLRYVRLRERRPIGAKRNLACELAAGDTIAHWDDDDWYAPDRLSRQSAALYSAGTKMCGLDTVLFLDIRTHAAWRFAYPPNQRKWLAGNSLMYRRDFWAAHRFPEIDTGEDSRFVWSAHPQDLVALPDFGIHVGIIHGGNVSAKQTNGPWWHAHPIEDIQKLLGCDWIRYAPQSASMSLGIDIAADAEPVPSLHNIYACLVHERSDCIIDLVRNLRCLDPASAILLYDGGNPPILEPTFPFERYGVIRHPAPRPQKWGRLHGFALDCMRYALQSRNWDTMTIVDSDQLALRPGFSTLLARHLAGRVNIGMLSNTPEVQPPNSRVPPVTTARAEIELWRPWLRRFVDGESKFVYWTFWPATVFTAAASRDLVRLFDEDEELRSILSQSAIWATEEVILPTLVALLGYDIAKGPTSYDYVAYRAPYSAAEIDTAMSRQDVFWAHPVPRHYRDPLRSRTRDRFAQYRQSPQTDPPQQEIPPPEPLRLLLPILDRMRAIRGWLEDDEADLLIAATDRALDTCGDAAAIVEVGSHLGRATVVLASVVQARAASARVHAVDPHDGHVGALDTGLVMAQSSPAQLQANLARAGVDGLIEIHHARAAEVKWDQRIELLLVDGLHDFANVSQDFFHFEPFLPAGALVAFHDYASYFPGVVCFVDELIDSGGWQKVAQVRSMIVLRRVKLPEERCNAGPDLA